MYIPTTEKGMDYVGNVGNFLEQLETKYKLPPVMPEAVALQNVMGPAAKQATKQAAKAAKPVVGKALEDYMFKQGLALPVVEPSAAQIGLTAPSIIIPGKVNNVREALRKNKGNYAVRRIERAADEIPNLERMFQEDALREAFTGDNAGAVVTMNPADFERYAIELAKRTSVGPKAAEAARQGDIDKMTVPTDNYINYLQGLEDGFSDVPYLNLTKDEVGLPTIPQVIGHEGRHRNRALADKGEKSTLVKINPRGDLREGMPRRTQEDFIEALRQELEMSKRLVLPEFHGSQDSLHLIRPAIELPEPYAKGGSVHIADNPDTMMMEVEDQKFSTAGAVAKQVAKRTAKTTAKAVENKPALPLDLPRAPAKTKEQIRPIAQRMAQQMTGEFVRPDPKKSVNPAGKSLKQFQIEQGLEHDIRPTAGSNLSAQQIADIEKQMGMLKIGVSGDTTIADQTLHRAGPYELDLPSPQHGGPLYGLGGEGAWASNNPVAATFQKRVQELSQAHGDAPVLGQFLAMGPSGSNFAMHFADANLRAIDTSKMSKSQINAVNDLIRAGTQKSGPRPSFSGIEDKESAYLQFAIDPELRKHFNAIMQKPDYTTKLGLPDGRVILHAITEPELRNTEILTSGLSQMRLDPSVDPSTLSLSTHPTYSHVIPKVPDSEIGKTKYLIPAEMEFPDVAEYAKKNYRPEDLTRVYQTATPRQMIDQQHIDEIRMYEEMMKELTGKKKGGAITKDQKFVGGGIAKAAKTAAKSAVATRELEKQAVLRAEAAAKSAAKQALMPQYNEAVKGQTQKQNPLSFEQWKAINYPEGTQGLRLNVKPPSDNIANVRGANFQYPKTVGNQTVKIGELSGGVRMSDPNEINRVQELAQKMSGPDGYISRIIVDHNNNVIEGQHRLEALRKLGIEDVPVYKIEELADTMPVAQMENAMQSMGGIHPDHVGQLVGQALENISEHGLQGARDFNYGKYQKFYDAALDAALSKGDDIAKADGGDVNLDAMYMAVNDAKFRRK
jgi:hypothetical protein